MLIMNLLPMWLELLADQKRDYFCWRHGPEIPPDPGGCFYGSSGQEQGEKRVKPGGIKWRGIHNRFCSSS